MEYILEKRWAPAANINLQRLADSQKSLSLFTSTDSLSVITLVSAAMNIDFSMKELRDTQFQHLLIFRLIWYSYAFTMIIRVSFCDAFENAQICSQILTSCGQFFLYILTRNLLRPKCYEQEKSYD